MDAIDGRQNDTYDDPLNIDLEETSTDQPSKTSYDEDEDDDDSDIFDTDEIEFQNEAISLTDLKQYEIPVSEIIYCLNTNFKFECMYCINIYDKCGLLLEHITEVHVPFNFIPKKVLRPQKVGEIKCGKILMSEISHFAYVCFLCHELFDEYKNFAHHILENHISNDGILKIIYKEQSREQNINYNNNFSLKAMQEIPILSEYVGGDKPWKCQFCNKGFKRDSDRKRHERIHTGEKPYKCDICDKAFTQSGTLKGHKRTHFFQKFRS